MRFLRLSLARELVPLGDSIQSLDVLNNQYLTDGTVIELCRIESDLENISSEFEDDPATINYEILEVIGEKQYVYHHHQPNKRNVIHQLMAILDEHQIMIVYPMHFDARTGASVTLMGATEQIQEAYNQLPAEVERYITIEQLSETMPALGGLRALLTDRQRQVLDAAIELGYYSVPREVTSKEIADSVGCAPSTASEHLRKIESRILSNLQSERP